MTISTAVTLKDERSVSVPTQYQGLFGGCQNLKKTEQLNPSGHRAIVGMPMPIKP